MGITLDSIKEKMIGNTFGKLTILSYLGRSERGDNIWRCKCECGTIVTGRTSNVDKDTSACNSCKRARGPRAKKLEKAYLNKRFGRLTVIENKGVNKYHQHMWRCRCDCGNEIVTRTSNFTSGLTKSCGCYALERRAEASTKHGLSDHPLYAVWAAMKDRCLNPNNASFHNYGERGIYVCQQWMDDFLSFYNWAMQTGYKPGLSIDRINNNGNYDPLNCRWATCSTQTQNSRKAKLTSEEVNLIRQDDRSHTEIAQDYDVDPSTISRVKSKSSWGSIPREPRSTPLPSLK